jgi:hypothetical protein
MFSMTAADYKIGFYLLGEFMDGIRWATKLYM